MKINAEIELQGLYPRVEIYDHKRKYALSSLITKLKSIKKEKAPMRR